MNEGSGVGATGSICLAAHDPGAQGAERALLDMAILLSEVGWEVTVLVPRDQGGLADLVDDAGLSRHTIRYYYWIGPGGIRGRVFRLVVNIVSLLRLVLFFRRAEFDIVYTHSIAVGGPALAARIAGIPHVWHLHEYGPFEDVGRPLQFDYGNRATFAMMRFTKSEFVAVADVIKDAYSTYLGASNIRVIHQPVPYDPSIAPEDEHAAIRLKACSGPTIIYVGAVTETKRQIDAVRALPRILDGHAGAHLFFVGRVEERYGRRLSALSDQVGVSDAIEYLGYCENAPALISLADISINCRLVEASPRVVYESMLAQTPVVACRAGGNAEAIGDDEFGVLYEPQDPEDLAKKVDWTLRNTSRVREITDRAAKTAYEERSVRMYATRYVKRIEGVISDAMAKRGAKIGG